ncbi:MAG: hypothetical protein H8E86_05450 [Planctomycetes bacterium]|nr:hypothetical protein [Planctomycetota bacterium]
MNTHEVTLWHWRIACLLWFVALTIATHLPQAIPSDEPAFAPPDKLLHFMCFGMLGFIFMCTKIVKNPWACWIIVALWAIADEVTQDLLPLHRAFSGEDLLAGELGIASFMVWGGALSRGSVANIQESVETTLSKTKNWVILCCIGFGVGIATMALFWFAYLYFTGKQHSQVAFVDATFITTGCVLWFFVCKGGLQQETKRIVKSMLPCIFLTILLAAMVGALASFTTFEPWVAAIAALVVGLRLAWNKAT